MRTRPSASVRTACAARACCWPVSAVVSGASVSASRTVRPDSSLPASSIWPVEVRKARNGSVASVWRWLTTEPERRSSSRSPGAWAAVHTRCSVPSTQRQHRKTEDAAVDGGQVGADGRARERVPEPDRAVSSGTDQPLLSPGSRTKASPVTAPSCPARTTCRWLRTRVPRSRPTSREQSLRPAGPGLGSGPEARQPGHSQFPQTGRSAAAAAADRWPDWITPWISPGSVDQGLLARHARRAPAPGPAVDRGPPAGPASSLQPRPGLGQVPGDVVAEVRRQLVPGLGQREEGPPDSRSLDAVRPASSGARNVLWARRKTLSPAAKSSMMYGAAASITASRSAWVSGLVPAR